MAQIACLQCARCGYRIHAESPQILCPLDGDVLYVRYDMDALRRTARRERPAELAAASHTSLGMWRYADVLPAIDPVTLGEGWTPLLQSRRFPGLLIKEEGSNPSGAFQARGLSLAVTMARHFGLKHLAIASAGDAASALAAYASAAGMHAHLYLPNSVPLAHYVEAVLYGADVTLVDGSISTCARGLEERIAEQKRSGVPPAEVWFDVSTAKEPYRVEGEKTLGYELVEQLGWRYPDAILYPAGCIGLLGIWKAFEEMEQLGWVVGERPRLYTVQPTGCAPATPADDIALEIVRASGGRVLEPGDETTLGSMQDWARNEGLFLSPQGAAAAAAYDALLGSGELKPANRVVLLNLGAGRKYTDTVAAAMHLRRPGSLPTSLPVGGIITPV
jgi:threonine synthase